MQFLHLYYERPQGIFWLSFSIMLFSHTFGVNATL